MVKVKALQTHYGSHGHVTTGQEYEVPDNIAAELKRNGLVEWDGKAAPPVKGESILVSDKKEPLTEKVVVEEVKEKKEVAPVKEKKEILKPVTKKK